MKPKVVLEISDERLEISTTKLVGRKPRPVILLSNDIYKVVEFQWEKDRSSVLGKKTVAVKIMNIDWGTVSLKEIKQEVETVQLLNPNFVVKIYGYVIFGKKMKNDLINLKIPGNIGIVMEKIDGLPLNKVRFKTGIDSITEKWNIIKRMCYSVAYIHWMKILHRNIQPNSFYIGSGKNEVKLCDFGMAKITCSHIGVTFKASGGVRPLSSMKYTSPEFCKTGFTFACDNIFLSDVFSLGLTIFEILTGEHPIDESKIKSGIDHIKYLSYHTSEHRKFKGKIWQEYVFFSSSLIPKISSLEEIIPQEMKENKSVEMQKIIKIIEMSTQIEQKNRWSSDRIIKYIDDEEDEVKDEKKE